MISFYRFKCYYMIENANNIINRIKGKLYIDFKACIYIYVYFFSIK